MTGPTKNKASRWALDVAEAVNKALATNTPITVPAVQLDADAQAFAVKELRRQLLGT